MISQIQQEDSSFYVQILVAHTTGLCEQFLLLMEGLIDSNAHQTLKLPSDLSFKAKQLRLFPKPCNTYQPEKPKAYLLYLPPTVIDWKPTYLRFILTELHQKLLDRQEYKNIRIKDSYKEGFKEGSKSG